MRAVVVAVASRQDCRGFSLLELLAVLAIIVAAATLFVPHLVGVEDRITLDAESAQLGRLLRLAQSRALSTRGNMTLQADTSNDRITIVEENLVTRLRVDLTTVEPPGDLVFSPTGGPSSEKTYTLLSPTGESRTVTVKAGTGHIAYGP